MDDVSDDELVALFREGDAEAFDTLFERYRALVYAFAVTMLTDRESAEDILQETFLRVAKSAKTYEPRGRFRAWLMRVARNLCYTRMRLEAKRERAITESGFELVRRGDAAPEAEGETAAALRKEIARLPERQREALVLYAFDGMTYRDIGEIMDVPTGTVKTLIHRARAELARRWQRNEGG